MSLSLEMIINDYWWAILLAMVATYMYFDRNVEQFWPWDEAEDLSIAADKRAKAAEERVVIAETKASNAETKASDAHEEARKARLRADVARLEIDGVEVDDAMIEALEAEQKSGMRMDRESLKMMVAQRKLLGTKFNRGAMAEMRKLQKEGKELTPELISLAIAASQAKNPTDDIDPSADGAGAVDATVDTSNSVAAGAPISGADDGVTDGVKVDVALSEESFASIGAIGSLGVISPMGENIEMFATYHR